MSPLVLTSGTMENDGSLIDLERGIIGHIRLNSLKTQSTQSSPPTRSAWAVHAKQSANLNIPPGLSPALLPFPRRRFPFSRYCINNPTGIDSLNIASLSPRCRSLKTNPQQCTVNVGQQTWVILSCFSWETGWQRNSGVAQYLVCGFVKGNAKHPHQHF